MPPESTLSLALIEEARAALAGRIRRTPLEPSPALTEVLGMPAWLKLEHLQATGSFKIRGALFRLAKLTAAQRAQGVATASAGNHGKGVAYAAKHLGVSATVYVPRTVDTAKERAMRHLGAQVVKTDFEGYDATEAFARAEAERLGRVFVSAFDDPYVMAGNGGTVAAEVLEACPAATTFVVPVGGGGHAAGFAYYAAEKQPGAQVIGCQLAACPALALSLARGQAVTEMPPCETVAGGLEGGLGTQTFAVLQGRVAQVALVSEAEIQAAVRWLLDQHQYLIEPSAAVTVAACLSGQIQPAGPTVVFLSGRNVSLATVQRILATPPA